MPRISFLNIINYLEGLAEKHVDIKAAYRWNVLEFSGLLRKGVDLPVMLIDAVETQTSGDSKKTIHSNSTAFTVLGKPNTNTGNIDEYEAQNIVLDFCQQICFDIEARIIEDSKIPQKDNKNNPFYGLINKNSFHFFKVGPIFSDGLYGYRCELTLKNKESLCVDKTKWTDM